MRNPYYKASSQFGLKKVVDCTREDVRCSMDLHMYFGPKMTPRDPEKIHMKGHVYRDLCSGRSNQQKANSKVIQEAGVYIMTTMWILKRSTGMNSRTAL